MATSDSMKWSQVAARGAGLKVLTSSPAHDRDATITSDILFQDPEYERQQMARKAAAIVRQALTPDSVLFSFPSTVFLERTDAYKAIEEQIGPMEGVRPLSVYDTRAHGNLLLEVKFVSPIHTTKAIQDGITVEDIVYKGNPSVAGAENPLVRVQLTLTQIASGDELKQRLLSSLRYYGQVYQVRRILRNGYFEGRMTITLDPSVGYHDEEGKLQDPQPLQRMLYLEAWDIFAPVSYKGAAPICYYCRQAGHIRSKCPDLAKRRCFGCGQTGHTKRFCRSKPSETELLDQYLQASATRDAQDLEDPKSHETAQDNTAGEQTADCSQDEETDTLKEMGTSKDQILTVDQEILEVTDEQEDQAPYVDIEMEDTQDKDDTQDPSLSIHASKHAPMDVAVMMKVDTPSEMMNLTRVKDSTKAKTQLVKRRLPKLTHLQTTTGTTKPKDKMLPNEMKAVFPPIHNSKSSAHRAQ